MLKNLKNKKKKGFTLIELIIVIAILAILAAIALPKFGQVRENANIKSDIANAKNIQSAVVALIGEGTIDNGASFTLGDGSDEAEAVEGYLQTVPTGKASSFKDENFSVTVNNIGDVTITISATPAEGAQQAPGVEVYPEGDGIYSSTGN